MSFLLPLSLVIIAGILIIWGAIEVFNASYATRKKGGIKLLIGLVLIGVLVVALNYIGNSFGRG